MPRRGERTRDFTEPAEEERPQRLGGIWELKTSTAHGRRARVKVDTTGFVCRRLADELAAELADYVELKRPHPTGVFTYRQGLLDLCSFVDRTAGTEAAACSLARPEPDVSHYIREWIRALPGQFEEGSTRPYFLAADVLSLIRFRGQHPERVLTPAVQRVLTTAMPASIPRTNRQMEEFTRAEKRELVRAAWADIRWLKQRLARGRELVAQGADPRIAGWTNLANLAFGLANDLVSPLEIWRALPSHHAWPPELKEVFDIAGVRFNPNTGRYLLTIALASLLYPRNIDLQSFRVLLIAATGHAPEEVAYLTEDDVEFVPGGVRLRLVKRRAHKIRYREFKEMGEESQVMHPDGAGLSTAEILRTLIKEMGEESQVMHPDGAGLSTAEILRTLIEVTAAARRRSTAKKPYLFVRGSVIPHTDNSHQRGELSFRPFEPVGRGGGLDEWVERTGVTVAGKMDIRRLRKSAKVEKTIAFRGLVSDAADDHTEQVFWGHYAHGTTLRTMAGHTITRAQNDWLQRALAGPVVLDEEAAGQLRDPEALDTLGLDAKQAEDIVQGELDMGVSSCRNPYQSPYSPPGEFCAVAPLRCLECTNAFILPSNLPQLLLFAEHVESLAARLDPRVFHQAWGQSRTNLKAVLADVLPADLERARQQITDQGLRLQLPLSSFVEFDS
ncbi:hypothetical protein DMH15_02815 [Streptomyces sp. WAC 06725]|uniref:hypothetical protein n=1 Tax=Streptomyces sp. WAC 06725 TaxID=2203209 RepID=UPI000F73A180|nr:hypothetical protein [Streptomyces sp. WAC 06725]RSO49622.1 hypothetical protein DMH15_02815 [Streptomyces sp. WAC 06725]